MKILHTSDLHIGKSIDTFNLKDDTDYVLNQVLTIADKEDVDVVLISGDIFDRSNPSEESIKIYANFLKKMLKKKKRRVLAIAGNHDSGVRLSAYNEILSDSARYFIEGEISLPFKKVTLNDEFGPVNFYLVPFFFPQEVRTKFFNDDQSLQMTDDFMFSKMMERENIDTSERNIILMHQFVAGCISSGSEQQADDLEAGGLSNIGVNRLDPFDYVALGHIHQPQRLTRDTIRYSGALLKYKTSEINKADKSVVIIDMKEKGNIELKLDSIKPLHPFIEKLGAFEDLMNPMNKTDAYVSVKLTDKDRINEAYRSLKDIYPNMVAFDYVNIVENSVLNKKINASVDNPLEFIKEYYKERKGEDMSDTDLAIVTDILNKLQKGGNEQ